MKVTVCELPNNLEETPAAWQALVDHVEEQKSDLVLLPEMPFDDWLARDQQVDYQRWVHSVAIHQSWLKKLTQLPATVICSTQPVIHNGRPHNEAFVWEKEHGYRAVHHKYYLPEEPLFWEASWYDRGQGSFDVTRSSLAKIGFLVCTELWFTEKARSYARQGIQLLLCPRASRLSSVKSWLAGGQAAAIMSGAFCLSSNRSGTDKQGLEWGGHGWIIEPEAGEILGTTSTEKPFLTLDIDLEEAQRAKLTYPRYVAE